MKDKTKKILQAGAIGLAFTTLSALTASAGNNAHNLSQELKSANNTISQQQELIKNLQDENAELQLNLFNMALDLKQCSAELEAAKNNIQWYEKYLANKEESHQISIAEYNKQITELSSKIATLTSELAHVNELYNKALENNEGLSESLKIALNNIATQATQINELSKQVSQGEIDLQQANNKIDELLEEIEELKNKNENSQDKNDKTENNGDTVSTLQDEIVEIQLFIDSKNKHSAEDRKFVHAQIDELMTKAEVLYDLGNATQNEYVFLMDKLDQVNDNYIIKNVTNTINNALSYDAIEMSTSNETMVQVAAYTQSKAYSYGQIYDNNTSSLVTTYATIDQNGTMETSTDGVYEKYDDTYKTNDLLTENFNGMISELSSALQNAIAVDYNSSTDTYSVTTETVYQGETTYSYNLDDNTLESYQLKTDDMEINLDFSEITIDKFEETYNKVYTEIEKAKESSSESERQ